ncbi:flavodoxin [Ligilactobacillus equi]
MSTLGTIIVLAFIIVLALLGYFFNKTMPTDLKVAKPMYKTLVLYFSPADEVSDLAHEVHQAVGGDIIELKGNPAYTGHDKTRAFKEWITGATPEQITPIPDLANYDTIFIGYPIWFGTAPMVIKDLLKKNGFAGKDIVPFAMETAISGKRTRSIRLLRTHAPRAKVLPRLLLHKGQDNQVRIAAYLKETGLK